jgi:hypothetical protein
MKKSYYNIFFILLILASCKNAEKPNEIQEIIKGNAVVTATPSAKTREIPHQSGSETGEYKTGETLNIIGISSHKDKIKIGGKQYEDY